jgi:glycosyltransferase involved in cell wall biosynthesis
MEHSASEELVVRVLMVSRGVLPIGRRSGGAEVVAFELARQLALQDHHVTLIADVEQQMLDGAPHGLSVRSLAAGRACARLALLIPLTFPRWLAQHLVGNMRAAHHAIATLKEHDARFDAVHTHGALATIMIGRAMRRSRICIPLFYTEHDSTPWVCAPRGGLERSVRRIVYRSVNLRACRHAGLVVTSYAALAMELTERTGLPPDRFAVAPNGADTKRLVPASHASGNGARPGMERYCLFVGSLIERKAPDILLRALALAKTDIGLIVVGGGPMAQELQRLTRRLHLTGRVVFTGAMPQNVVYRYYQKAAFLVLPSVSETMSLVVIEALSAGKPVVVSDLKGIADVVCHGENGLLVPPGDVKALSAAIELLATDDDLYTRLASNAAASVRDSMTWDTIARQLHLLYAQESIMQGVDTPAFLRSVKTVRALRIIPFSAGRLRPNPAAASREEEENMHA